MKKLVQFTLFLALVAFAPSCTAALPETERSTPAASSPADDKLQDPVALGGWGPERPTFRQDSPADYITLNSLTKSSWGDERNFLQVKNKDSPNSEYTDDLEVAVGKTYTAILMYRNAASSRIATPAENTAMRVMAPGSIKGAGEINGFLQASNSNPLEVWDSVVIRLTDPASEVALRYVPGSAVIHSRGRVNGLPLPDELYTTGTPIGCDQLDGRLFGGEETCTGYVTFDFILDQPNFTVTTLGKSPQNHELTPSISARVGDTLEMRGEYKNTGTTLQNDVVMDLNLPAGMEMVSNNMKIANSATDGTYKSVSEQTANTLLPGILNIGSYKPGGSCYIKFSVTIHDVPGYDFATSGQVYRYPEIYVHTNNGSKVSFLRVKVLGPLQ
ncbi:hypothetical protein [Paenarthrobacter aromaticivorans]|uniref:DUF11 domain-containing protein n=1 Tax=Paenarthrobacter aromaticivorans TaxID=2849150 RepID=A0ABS6IB27_9MICC|nr:hypothetical protein [Paenarthrobacter sp. MMS21-TAE1-1]MBU8868562.1 hypothetical protein [Paenarthrobacter sp. MMS21-TAE1-1]